MNIREIRARDDKRLGEIIRYNLKKNGLDIPGTVYFDKELDCLSGYYLASPERMYYVVVDEYDIVVGGIGLDKFNGLSNCAELQKLYLADHVKGQGFGYELISFVKEKAILMGYKQMYLETHTNLATAIHMYEKMGFEEIQRLPDCVHSTMNYFCICQL